jgi:metalloendopeptidase OMA1, mitochondrial
MPDFIKSTPKAVNPSCRLSGALCRVPARLFFFALLCILAATGCSSIDPLTQQRVHNYYTIEEDIELGASYLKHNVSAMRKKGVGVNQDAEMKTNLDSIVARIASVSDIPDLPYTLTLFQCDVVNAAAAPGGAIMVYEGLYHPEKGLVRTNEELAAVIAHEIAHVTCRHGTRQLSRRKTASVFGSVMSAAVSITAGVLTGSSSLGKLGGDIFDTAYSVGAGLWFPSYSRTQEYEADSLSLLYMARARINPRPALDIWRRAAAESEGEKSSIYASHPNDEDRLTNLEKLLPQALALYEEAGGDFKEPVTVFPWEQLQARFAYRQ